MDILSLLRPHGALRTRIAGCRPALYRLAVAWCHDRVLADDLAQEALAKALAHAGQLRDQDKLRPWLYGILANCWRDHLRALRPAEDIDALGEHWLATVDSTEPSASRAQLARQVRARR